MKTKTLKTLVAALMVGATMAGPALAEHTWYSLNYSKGICEKSTKSPEDTYNMVAGSWGQINGFTVHRIMPSDVVKDSDGNIMVTIRATQTNGDSGQWRFFTSEAACKAYIITNGVKPQQVPSEDIN